MDILSLCALCILFAAAILPSIYRDLSQYTYSYASQPQSQYYFLCSQPQSQYFFLCSQPQSQYFFLLIAASRITRITFTTRIPIAATIPT